MIIRKLEQSEHIATRKLWEEIFPEDTKAFLDYYYYIKAAKNSNLRCGRGWENLFNASVESISDPAGG